MPSALLDIRDLTVEYGSGGYVVRPLDALSFAAAEGTLVLTLGPSGSGKSTLLSCLAGILTPTRGTIRFGDVEVTTLTGRALTQYRRHTVGVVFQAFNLVPSLYAVENVMVPLRAAGVAAAEARARAESLLEQVGLADRRHHRPGELSGGQQQRVAIARALALDPPLVIADEPTAHLDYIQVESVLAIMQQVMAAGRVVVVATHDDRMLPLADQVVELVPRFHERRGEPERVELAEGAVLFEQGSRGERIYVIEDGAVDVVRQREDGAEEFVARLFPGECVGEMGPLFGLPRSATVRARTPAVLTGYTVLDFRERFGDQRIGAILSSRRTRTPPAPR